MPQLPGYCDASNYVSEKSDAQIATLRYTGVVAADIYQQFTQASWQSLALDCAGSHIINDRQENMDSNTKHLDGLPKACVFVNPACDRHKAKLRLAFEAAPLALLVERAGGATSDLIAHEDVSTGDTGTSRSILDIPIVSMTQTTPMCAGAVSEVKRCFFRVATSPD